MGLDVYLHKYKHFEKTKKIEKEYDKESEEIWGKDKEYEEMTKEEKNKASKKCKELSIKMGLSDWGSDEKNRKSIELNSKKYPKHYFKIGYFRSSYNESGFNSVMRNFIGKDLYDIFEIKDDYEIRPNWKEAKVKAEEMLKEIKDKIGKDGSYRVFRVRHNEFSENPKNHLVNSEKKALEEFFKVKRKHKSIDSFGSFSNSSGEFFLKEPLEISGIISGVNKSFFVDKDIPCVYVVYKDKDFDYYVQALEIVIETIDYALKQKDIDKYYLSWSG